MGDAGDCAVACPDIWMPMQSGMNADKPDQHIDSGVAEHCYYPVGEAVAQGDVIPFGCYRPGLR